MFAFVKAAQLPVRNPVVSAYWTMGVVRHGDYIAKLRVAPVEDSAAHVIHRELDLRSGPDVFGPALADDLRAGAFDFDLQVQLCTDLDAMPVNDAMVEWPLGEIMKVRRIYSASAKMRRTLNRQPQNEPASADDVLPASRPPGGPARNGPARCAARGGS